MCDIIYAGAIYTVGGQSKP